MKEAVGADSSATNHWWDRASEKKWFKILSHDLVRNIATLGAVLFAIVSLHETLSSQRKLVTNQEASQRVLAALAAENEKQLASNLAWERYMEFSMQNAELASDEAPFTGTESKDNQPYIWYSERLIFAAEQILSNYPNDPQWFDTVAYELARKKRYLISDYFLKFNTESGTMAHFCTYTKPTRLVIAFSLRLDPAASMKISKAESNCAAHLSERGVPNA